MTAAPGAALRGRGTVVGAAVVVLAVLAGLGTGGTLALWRDEVRGAVQVPVGVAVFGVGAPSTPGTLARYATADPETLTFAFGPAQAAALYNDGAGGTVAVPVQVDALAQGHRGLTYTVTPSVSGGVFGASTLRLYEVASAAACSRTTDATTGVETTTSTPVTSDYSTSTTVVSEYWCLVATYVPVAGAQQEEARVTGTPVIPDVMAPDEVSDSESWGVRGEDDLRPGAEPEHTLAFSFRTFRPGGAS